jgi:hypothetical protein
MGSAAASFKTAAERFLAGGAQRRDFWNFARSLPKDFVSRVEGQLQAVDVVPLRASPVSRKLWIGSAASMMVDAPRRRLPARIALRSEASRSSGSWSCPELNRRA